MPPETRGDALKNQDGIGTGDKIGPYLLKRKLGQGGMGSVFEAVHESSGQQVALKLLTSGTVSSSEESVQRFRRESQIAASINHPRSTFVYESGQHNDQIYITMELMPGGTLQDVVDAEGAQHVNKAVDYVLDMIEGLQVAHDAGIVHRDIKPSNSFVDDDGRIKVGDFGLAKSVIEDSSLTRTGMFMGTPQFAAPEQIKGGDIDERTDIYALGGTLFYLLAGRAPFTGNPAQVIASIASDTPPKVSEFASGVPKALTKLIDQTLAKDPAKRPYNLHVLRELLLPYSASGAYTADIGRRMAGYFLDMVIAATTSAVAGSLLAPLFLMFLEQVNIHINLQLATAIFQIPFLIFYFAIFESVFGKTPGKWLFGTRVMDEDGEIPKFWQSLVRALIIPGVPMCGSMLISGYLMSGANLDDVQEMMKVMIETQGFSFLSWLTVFAILYPARKSNGYRGYHGLFSGTRVVRLSGDVTAIPLDKFEITAPLKLSDAEASAMNFQPYTVFGRFSSKLADGNESVLLGKDPELDRQVWIFNNVQPGSISPVRKHLLRPHRLRVIHMDQKNGKAWYCTESTPGVPLIDVVKRKPCTWQSVRPILRDLAHELENAQEQNLLPQNLGLDHVWIDHTGRVRLLDHKVVANSTLTDETHDPVSLMLKIMDRVFDFHAFPMHAMEFRNELAARKNESGILDWAGDKLADMAEQPSTWNWDDRVGMFAISMGIEVSLFSAVLFSIGFLSMWLQVPTWAGVAIAMAGGLAAAGLLAFFTHGGIAARASDVLVCSQSSFGRASRIQCALRAIVGWIPWLAVSAAFLFLMLLEANSDGLEGGLNLIEVGSEPAPTAGPDTLVAIGLLVALAAALITFAGMLFAVLFPARGIQDVIAHTRLIKK